MPEPRPPATNAARGGKSAPVRLSPRQIAVLAVLAVTVVFIAQNRDPVRIELFTIDVTAPLWTVLAVMTVLGLLLGVLVRRRR